MLQSRDAIFMEDKFDVKKSDCTQENFEFFTVSVGNADNDDAECATTTRQKTVMLKIRKWLSTKKLKDLNKQGDYLTD